MKEGHSYTGTGLDYYLDQEMVPQGPTQIEKSRNAVVGEKGGGGNSLKAY